MFKDLPRKIEKQLDETQNKIFNEPKNSSHFFEKLINLFEVSSRLINYKWHQNIVHSRLTTCSHIRQYIGCWTIKTGVKMIVHCATEYNTHTFCNFNKLLKSTQRNQFQKIRSKNTNINFLVL